MAEGKNGVIVYCDWIHTIEKLNDEQAGKVFKHFLRYINDENPQADDILTDVAFEPMKQSLKRDLNKWEQTKEIKSDSGKLGNLKRWHKDIYDKVCSKKITLERGIELSQNIANSRKTSQTVAHRKKQSQNIANIAVSDSVSVSVSVIKKLNKKKASLCEVFIPFFSNKDFQEVWIDFEKVREKKKASTSDRTYKTLMKKLLELSGGKKSVAMKIVAKSADSGWSDLYQLDKDDTKKTVKPKNNRPA